MHSDDETVDVAGSEEEETDSEREPSAEATTSTVAFFLTPIFHFSRCLIHPWGSSCPQEGVALNQVGRILFSLNILLISYQFFTDQYDAYV